LSDGGEQHQGVGHLPPPLTYLVFLILGLLANLYYPVSFSSSGSIVPLALGLVIVTIGLLVGGYALRAMTRAGVTPVPWRAPEKLVIDGPFRFSRNPLFISLTVMYIGISVVANTIWPLGFLVFALVIVNRETVLQEERFLEKKFGEEYRSYKMRVRRWI